jgi:hypothetical protein
MFINLITLITVQTNEKRKRPTKKVIMREAIEGSKGICGNIPEHFNKPFHQSISFYFLLPVLGTIAFAVSTDLCFFGYS